MKRKQKREYFFDKGATALNKYNPSIAGCYICPLCTKAFSKEAISNGTLTLEHVPPKSLGGNEIVLTCSRCNNTAGSRLDSQMLNREKVHSLLDGVMGTLKEKSIWATLKMGGEQVNVEMKINGKDVRIYIHSKKNPPKVPKNLESHLADTVENDTWQGQQFGISHKDRYRKRNAQIGDLRCAYLASFAALGYQYLIKNPLLEIIRQQIKNPNEEILENYWLPSPAMPKDERKIILINRPFPCLLVQMGRVRIWLSTPDSPTDLYQAIPQYADGKYKWQGNIFPWPKTLEMKLDFID